MTEKDNHKGFDADAGYGASVVEQDARDYGFEIAFDPRTEGGIVYGPDDRPDSSLRPPQWRGDPDTISPSDFNVLRYREAAPGIVPRAEDMMTGAELELLAVGQDGQPHEFMVDGNPMLERLNGSGPKPYEDFLVGRGYGELRPHKLDTSAEMAKSMIEVNFDPHADMDAARQDTLEDLTKLAVVFEGSESDAPLIAPVSAYMDRPLTPKAVNDDPYVQRIGMEYMGWENLRHFVGASVQHHVEMITPEAGAYALNRYQQASPFMYGSSLSGPWVHGELNPNLAKLYGEEYSRFEQRDYTETMQAIDAEDWMSVRYPSRWRGSPSGGTFEEPLPEDQDGIWALAEERMAKGFGSRYSIPTPSRMAGHHTERLRLDVGEHGTVELCDLDTYGAHIEKLAAAREMTRVVMWKLQVAQAYDAPLLEDYSDLFNADEMNADDMRVAHFNQIAVARDGLGATVIDAQGNERNAREMMHRLIAFADEPVEVDGEVIYTGLSERTKEEMLLSSETHIHDEVVAEFSDEGGIVSMRGYYATGLATPAHWMKLQATQIKEQEPEKPDDEIIRMVTLDTARAFHGHIHTKAQEHIANGAKQAA